MPVPAASQRCSSSMTRGAPNGPRVQLRGPVELAAGTAAAPRPSLLFTMMIAGPRTQTLQFSTGGPSKPQAEDRDRGQRV
jgi:hypothetical protein